MTQPLALILYEKLLPGTQLVNRLQDLNYRVQTISDPDLLVLHAEQDKPMLVLADTASTHKPIADAILRLKQNPGTKHIPIIAIVADDAPELQQAAQSAGATLVVGETAILTHLPQILDQALQFE